MSDISPSAIPRLPLLDSLRGWAAISVLTYHTFAASYLQNVPGIEWLAIFQAHRAAVMLFFTLSGYVIGATNSAPWTVSSVAKYGKRRFIRIEPIYLVAIILGVLANTHVSLRDVIGNCLFLQNLDLSNPTGVRLLPGNEPLWSIHFEALYYLLFVIWWRWPSTVPVFLFAGILGSFAGARFHQVPDFWVSHATGIVFWLVGLLISHGMPVVEPAKTGWVWAHILWLHATQHAATLMLILKGLHLASAPSSWLTCGDFALLPGCITLVAFAARRRLPGVQFWPTLSFLMPLLGCVIIIFARKPFTEPRWAAVLAFTLAGLLAGHWKATGALRLAEKVGSFSYGLYAVHMPILILVLSRLGPDPTFLRCFSFTLAVWLLSFTLAALLELQIQPRIRALFLQMTEGRGKKERS